MPEPPDLTHHTAQLNRIKQHWVSAGRPPVHLLHGFTETWYGRRKQVPVLAERFTVIAPDLRGCGDTDKPAAGYDKRTMANDVVALLDRLGHERSALVGHDRGYRVGTRFAKDHRESVDGAVAMDNIPPCHRRDVRRASGPDGLLVLHVPRRVRGKGIARDVRGVCIPQCGRLCQEERSDVVNRELLGFLTGCNG
ncbi:alpha/beta fold hydrolase [Streptomyces canus]|uniref:alpha/beta fold hydrolase n=1 Tax=Streptomyces canus TaxID=58343 RepID=UPI0033A1FE87